MAEPPVKIVLIDENLPEGELVRETRARDQRVFEIIIVASRALFEQLLAEEDIDLILTSPRAFGFSNAQIIDLIQAQSARQPVLIFTAMGAERSALEAMKRGAVDYVVKLPIKGKDDQLISTELEPSLSSLSEKDENLKSQQPEDETQLATKVIESTAEGIFITDAKADIISINKAFTEITGYHPEEVLGKKTHRFHAEERDKDFFDQMWASLEVTGRWQGEIWNRRKDGEIYPEWLTINAVKNEKGELTNYVGIFTDITARKKSEERLRYLATHDPLTDLPNRDLFQDRLAHVLARARRQRQQTAVLLLDMDNFKNVNDTLGHTAGDMVLKIISDRLRCCLRTSDTVARMGGDEFTFILEDVPKPADCVVVAKKILKTLSEPYLIERHKITLTASIGISLFPDDGLDTETLLKHADIAMYRAKQNRNSFQFFNKEP